MGRYTKTRAIQTATLFPVTEGVDRIDIPPGTRVLVDWSVQPKPGLVLVRLLDSEVDLPWLAKRQDFERAPETFNGSPLLDEYWRATARAPRRFPGSHEVLGSSYERGLDVLGATTKMAAVKQIAASAPRPAAAPSLVQRAAAALPAILPAAARQAATQPAAARPAAAQPSARVAPQPASRSAPLTSAAKAIAKQAADKKAKVAAKTKAAATAKQKQVANRAKTSAQKAIAAGNKLAKSKSKKNGTRHVKAGKKLVSAGNWLKNFATKIQGDSVFGIVIGAVGEMFGFSAAGNGAGSSPEQFNTPSSQSGSDSGSGGGMAAAIAQIAAMADMYTSALEQMTQAAGVLNAMLPVLDQVSDPSQSQSGQDLANQLQDIYDQFNDDPGNSGDVTQDQALVSNVSSLMQQANAWLQQNSGKTVVSTTQNPDGSIDTKYSDGTTTHTNADGTQTTTNPDGSVTSGPAASSGPPSITGISASAGVPGDIVTITGTNFTAVNAVSLGGASVQFSVDAPTQISLMIPTGAQSGVLKIASPAGAATTMFQVMVDPNASQFDPGGYGGGGGGGGFDEGSWDQGGGGGDAGYPSDDMAPSASEAVQQFRNQGVDPFAEDDSQSYAPSTMEDAPVEDEQPFDDTQSLDQDADADAAPDQDAAMEDSASLLDQEKALLEDDTVEGWDAGSWLSQWEGLIDDKRQYGETQTSFRPVPQGQPSADVAARLAAAQQKAQVAKAALLSAYSTQGQNQVSAPSFSPAPSASFADRLAQARAAISAPSGSDGLYGDNDGPDPSPAIARRLAEARGRLARARRQLAREIVRGGR